MILEDYNVSEVKIEDVELFLDHMENQINENGKGDTPVYMSLEPSTYTVIPLRPRFQPSLYNSPTTSGGVPLGRLMVEEMA